MSEDTVPRVWKKWGRGSEAESKLLVKLVEAAGSSEVNWKAVDAQVGIKNCETRWKKIQTEAEIERKCTSFSSFHPGAPSQSLTPLGSQGLLSPSELQLPLPTSNRD